LQETIGSEEAPRQGREDRVVLQSQLLQVGVVHEGVTADGLQLRHPAKVQLLQGEEGLEGLPLDLYDRVTGQVQPEKLL